KKQQDEPTRLIVMHTNLALYKLGLAGDNLFKYRDGNKAMKSPREILPMRLAGTFFYYQYGKPNYCYRWCMEDMVEYGMNASVLRYFVLSCIMNGETNLARKYNRILASTLFYKSWAKKYQYYIDHPDKVATAPEFANIISLTAYDNILDGDDSMLELYLKNSFAYMGGGTPALVEASLLFNLDMKDIPRFWPRFFLYARTHNRIPVHYQEAALLYQHLEQKVSLDNLPLDRNVVTNFNLFLDYVQKYVQYPEDQIRPFFYNQFGDTFWFYYFFVKDHSTAGLKRTRS
ncbi:MAG: DUF6057 family protein, partial [Bacteroidota bacterium]|nr:DUF6057 family protein [Bacteroidota bacterium]